MVRAWQIASTLLLGVHADCSGAECEATEQIAMVQRINRHGMGKTDSPATQLLQAATKLLMTGSDGKYDVVNFTKATLETLPNIVQEISDNHVIDQERINTAWATVKLTVDIWRKHTREIKEMEIKEDECFDEHNACRGWKVGDWHFCNTTHRQFLDVYGTDDEIWQRCETMSGTTYETGTITTGPVQCDRTACGGNSACTPHGSEQAMCDFCQEKNNWCYGVYQHMLEKEREYIHSAWKVREDFCDTGKCHKIVTEVKNGELGWDQFQEHWIVNPMSDKVYLEKYDENCKRHYWKGGFKILIGKCWEDREQTVKDIKVHSGSFSVYSESITEWCKADECCDECNTTYHEKTAECNKKQGVCEQMAFERVKAHEDFYNLFYNSYVTANTTLHDLHVKLRVNEHNRKREYVTLDTVSCLLHKIMLRNGTKCKDSSEAEGEIADCSRRHEDDDVVCNGPLCIDWDHSNTKNEVCKREVPKESDEHPFPEGHGLCLHMPCGPTCPVNFHYRCYPGQPLESLTHKGSFEDCRYLCITGDCFTYDASASWPKFPGYPIPQLTPPGELKYGFRDFLSTSAWSAGPRPVYLNDQLAAEVRASAGQRLKKGVGR